jgi:hypothetical protein
MKFSKRVFFGLNVLLNKNVQNMIASVLPFAYSLWDLVDKYKCEKLPQCPGHAVLRGIP